MLCCNTCPLACGAQAAATALQSASPAAPPVLLCCLISAATAPACDAYELTAAASSPAASCSSPLLNPCSSCDGTAAAGVSG
jgi:hypothetical protein